MWVDQEYHLPNDFKQKLRERPVPWGGGILSQATFYRTYSRIMDNGRNEHFADVVIRNVEGVMRIRKSWYKLIGQQWDDREMGYLAESMAERMFEMKFLPPGRGLYAMGTEYVEKRGNAALNNCGFVDLNNYTKPSDSVAWLMDHLMLGVGVGFRVPTSLKQTDLKRPVGPEVTHVVEDSREGWVESTRLLVNSYEVEYQEFSEPHPTDEWGRCEKPIIKMDYSQVRPAGSPIKGFGGTSSGPQPLIDFHEKVRSLLDAALDEHGNGWTDTNLIADIMNLAGVCVIAGNVRRSAEIALGPIKEDFINLKNYGKSIQIKTDEGIPGWKQHEDAVDVVYSKTKPGENWVEATIWIPGPAEYRMDWGYMSNNSIVLEEDDDFMQLPDLAERILDNGEPGLVNMINIRKRGRYQDKVGENNWLREDFATGMNPCGEIPLESFELCNLVEVFPTRAKDYHDWTQTLRAATFFASTVSLLPSHDSRTNAVVSRNRRIGVSVSGYADWVDSTPMSTIHRWLDNGYTIVRHENKFLADEAGVPASVRLTTVKPSGTVSLLPWVSPGMHHPVKNRFIRRVTFRQDDPVTERLIAAGVPYEPLLTDPNGSYSFEFPMQSANGGRTRSVEHVPIYEQVAHAQFLARVWADNAVSFTGTIAAREKHLLAQLLPLAIPTVKSLSFLVNNDENKAYDQAPYEGITVDEYERRAKAIQQIDWSDFGGSDGQDSLYCDGDVCELPF